MVTNTPDPEPAPEKPKDADGNEEEEDPEAAAMAAMMGFGGFGSTKVGLAQIITDIQGQKTGQAEEGGANVHKMRTWRQYMNRRGGFNRPLEKML